MQRNEGPAYHGRPVGGILPEVSWVTDASRSNSAIHFDPTGEHCSRTAPAENTSGKINSRLAGPLCVSAACLGSCSVYIKRIAKLVSFGSGVGREGLNVEWGATKKTVMFDV